MKYISKISILMLSILLTASGCSSIIDARKQKEPFISKYYSGDLKDAAEELLKKRESRRGTGDELTWCLDAGTAAFDNGEYQISLKIFERAEEIIKDYRDRAVINARAGGVELGAVATNENAIPYKGMAVDKIMLNSYKAINYWASGNPEGAQVELRRMREIQQNILKEFQDEIDAIQKQIDAENKKNNKTVSQTGSSPGSASMSFESILQNPVIHDAYQSSEKRANKLYGALGNPFATYLSAIGYLLENNYGEAMVDFRNLYKMIPNNKLVQKDYIQCAKRLGDKIPPELSNITVSSSPLNTKIVYILFYNGRAPALKQRKFQIILPFVGYTGIAFPQYEYFQPPFASLQVNLRAGDKNITEKTEQIVNFDSIMSQEYHMRLPTMITRLVISQLTKEIGSYVAVEAARNAGGDGAGFAAMAATGFYKWMFNTADTRCWETLPQDIEITHVPIPADGELILTPLHSDKTVKITPSSLSSSALTHSSKSYKIQLKKTTKVAIVYVRALSSDKIIYKLFEIE